MNDKTITPVGEHPFDALATRMMERIRRAPSLAHADLVGQTKHLTAKHLLGWALEAELQMKKNELEILQGITALAKAAVAEKNEAASPRVPMSDCLIPVNPNMHMEAGVVLWGIQGLNYAYNMYPTKMCAEIAARAAFPDEDPYARYARIYCKQYKALE
jgi:hypothetical protein